LKYTPRFPSSPFNSIKSANEWVSWFVSWYNNERLHGEIKYVTPISRHNGKDSQILKNRQVLYEKARAKNPARWSGKTKNWTHDNKVYLNPTNEQKDMIKERKNVA
jgi:putative transposase